MENPQDQPLGADTEESTRSELERLANENRELRRRLGLEDDVVIEIPDAPDFEQPEADDQTNENDEESETEEAEEVCGLFGIINSNRDHTSPLSWGKNQFNNSFPIGLISYMASKGIEPVYLKTTGAFAIEHSNISFSDLTGLAYDPSKIYYEFEFSFAPFKALSSSDHLPGIDVIVKNNDGNREAVKALEIKLTTLPDSITAHLSEDKYGSELVIRPDTIVYQALSISQSLQQNRSEVFELLNPVFEKVSDWEDEKVVAKHLGALMGALSALVAKSSDKQKPLLLQPVWKTEGKAAILAEDCLDAFVWSDFSLMKLFIKNADTERIQISRNDRTIVWLFLMLRQFAVKGKLDHKDIIDRYTYGTKNDKAFAVSGKFTNNIMACPELTKPRIKKKEISKIILGNGQEHLSPERRFDGVVQSDVSIFA